VLGERLRDERGQMIPTGGPERTAQVKGAHLRVNAYADLMGIA
jgi:hypothetical protein